MLRKPKEALRDRCMVASRADRCPLKILVFSQSVNNRNMQLKIKMRQCNHYQDIE